MLFVAKYHRTHFHVAYLAFQVSAGLTVCNFWDEWLIDLQEMFVLG